MRVGAAPADVDDRALDVRVARLGFPCQQRSRRHDEARLAVTAWLSGGGEDTTNHGLQSLLGYPAALRAVGTIPVGVPEKDVASRYRRPSRQMTHWNRYEPEKFRPQAMVDYYVSDVRQFAMYRDVEDVNLWDDVDKRLGPWREAFTGPSPNPSRILD